MPILLGVKIRKSEAVRYDIPENKDACLEVSNFCVMFQLAGIFGGNFASLLTMFSTLGLKLYNSLSLTPAACYSRSHNSPYKKGVAVGLDSVPEASV